MDLFTEVNKSERLRSQETDYQCYLQSDLGWLKSMITDRYVTLWGYNEIGEMISSERSWDQKNVLISYQKYLSNNWLKSYFST